MVGITRRLGGWTREILEALMSGLVEYCQLRLKYSRVTHRLICGHEEVTVVLGQIAALFDLSPYSCHSREHNVDIYNLYVHVTTQ